MDNLTRIPVEGVPAGFRELRHVLGEVTLNYAEGPDNGLPLLLIPGQMESWQGYKPVLPDLSRRFHVFAVDLRGHGKSTRTPGKYSYHACGEDLKLFLREVIRTPALVAGLSSGGVLAIWLAAYAPEDVLAIVSEDPPIFSSIWPRIRDEKFMSRNFQVAVDVLGGPGERDPGAYLMQMGIPTEGKDELLMIPHMIIRLIAFIARLNRTLRPDRPYDPPLLPFNMRAGMKFLSEYDTDFSRATLDGDLSKGFDPEDALRRVRCPMLLIHVRSKRHPTWGLLGAMDDKDVKRVTELVPHAKVVELTGGHEVHMLQPRRYISEVLAFADESMQRNAGPA